MTDVEEMIKKEISLIGGLQERVVFKDIVEQVFLSLYETNQEMYKELEGRIIDDLAFDINRYQICTGIVEKEFVDKSHHLLAPMREEDLEESSYDAAFIREQLKEKGRCPVKTLFMECDYLQIKKLLSKKKITGTVKTEKGEYTAEFLLELNDIYLREINHLYEAFTGNGIPWQTVNSPYLYKFIQVYITYLPEELAIKEAITDILPDLEEFGEWAHDNYIPLWNIRKLKLNSVGFPVPCEDHKSFEHTISIKEYGSEHVYLIDDRQNIYNIRQKGNRLTVMGKESEARKWQVYMIRSGQNRKFERFTYPLMVNQRRDDFVERFWRRQGMNVRTNAELMRFIRSFGMEDYVEYEGYEIQDRMKGTPETYSMNSFILDEIREGEYKKRLILNFRKKSGERTKTSFLLRDIMSFLVSEVQLLYGEYMCEGRLL